MKLSKKELKTPDRLWIDMKKILEWLTEELTVLILAIVVLFGATVIGVYLYQKKLSTEGRAQYHYAQAKSFAEQMKIMPEDSNDPKAAKKNEAPKEKKSAEQVKAEKLKAETDLKNELAVLEKDFSGSKANQMAEMLRGQIAVEKGDWTAAVKYYANYSKSLKGDDASLGLYPLAQAQEQAGMFEEALKSYIAISELKNSAHREWALLGKARVLKALNRVEDAKKTYEAFLSAFPNSTEASSVRGLMAALGGSN